ncbi:MAG: AcrB/AcrD/AcrF family protein [Candidatus Aegiribacteria sp.]|nr:AcrB/AcrD/AcrF family protein [Candidatus Aegiribacteria sp.]MBD3294236.1 AcrB/AcrD/AcrF family protein [Candidatus Fermentibacteria bacterium]
MIKRLVDACLRNPVAVILLAALAGGAGIWAFRTVPIDAFPDISENQIIVSTEWPGRSPDDVQDQITYPLTVELQGIPDVTQVRGMSGFGFSQVYVVFRDGVDFYWARTRVLERLSGVSRLLPEDARPELGPDATPLGQIYWYTVEGPYDLATLRTLQDYTIRYALQSVPGVSEVSSVGGYVLEYAVEVDPNTLYSYGLDIADVIGAVSRSNLDVGARTLEESGMEFIVRGSGQLEEMEDLEQTLVSTVDGVPITVGDIATVATAPAFRRGALADHNGELVGGIVVMRKDANPVQVIETVEQRLDEIRPGLPDGVTVSAYYDRRQLIEETVDTLSTAIVLEMLITMLVILLFLLHLRSSLIVASSLPYAVLLTFIAMRIFGISANIMSFAGIAIAIGTLVDMGIVVVENIHLALAPGQPDRPVTRKISDAVSEVAPAILTSLGTTIISFIPVFFLSGQSGRLFIPLAWTKTFVLAAAGITAITLVPVLAVMFIAREPEKRKRLRTLMGVIGVGALAAWGAWSVGSPDWLPLHNWLFSTLVFASVSVLLWKAAGETLVHEQQKKITDRIIRFYTPVLEWSIDHRRLFVTGPAVLILAGFMFAFGADTFLRPLDAAGFDTDRFRPTAILKEIFPGTGTQFMPPLDEGSFLFMPSLLNQAGFTEVVDAMIMQNSQMVEIPEVDRVVGKAGRADSPLDPAPSGMIETVITLLPRDRWREGVTSDSILTELREAAGMPGIAPSWLQPIETRIVMLQSGIRTSIGCEIHGTDYREIERVALAFEDILSRVPGARDVSALRTGRRPYIEFQVDRDAAARYGVPVERVQKSVAAALGGISATTVISGRERSSVRVLYARGYRDQFADLERILVRSASGEMIPVSLVADVQMTTGASSIRSVDGELVGYVMLNASGRDEGGVVEEADRLLRQAIQEDNALPPQERTINLPQGYYFRWVGNYQNQIEARERFSILIPTCLLLIFILMYLQFRTLAVPMIIFFGAVPLAVAGGFIFMQLWPFLQDILFSIGVMATPSGGPVYMTVAVIVGFIALLGICVDDGVLMSTYINQLVKAEKPTSRRELRAVVVSAGRRRIRPAVMTTVTTIIALIPVILASGRGSELSRPMALPVFGGMLIEFMTMLIVPVVYHWWLERKMLRAGTFERSED